MKKKYMVSDDRVSKIYLVPREGHTKYNLVVKVLIYLTSSTECTKPIIRLTVVKGLINLATNS